MPNVKATNSPTDPTVDFSKTFADIIQFVDDNIGKGKKVVGDATVQQSSLVVVHGKLLCLLAIFGKADADKALCVPVEGFIESCQKLCDTVKQAFPNPGSEPSASEVGKSFARLMDMYPRLFGKGRPHTEEVDAARPLYTIVKQKPDMCRRCQRHKNPHCAFRPSQDGIADNPPCWQCWRDKKGVSGCLGPVSMKTELPESKKRKEPPSPEVGTPTRDPQAARNSGIRGITNMSSSTDVHSGRTLKSIEKRRQDVSPSPSDGEETDISAPSMPDSQSRSSMYGFMYEPRDFALQIDSMFADLTIQIQDQGTTIRNAEKEKRLLCVNTLSENNTIVAEYQAQVEAASVEYRHAKEEHARRMREANKLLEEAKTVYEGAKDEAAKDKENRIGRVVSQHRVYVERIDAERDVATAAAVATGRRGLLDRVTDNITSFVAKHGTTPFNSLGGAHGSRASNFVATYAELLEEKLLANDPSLTDFLRKVRDVLPNYVQGLAIQGDEAAGNSERVAL